MRITFVHKTANFSGGNRVVATYAERLVARGHHVCVVSAPDARPMSLRHVFNPRHGRTARPADGRSWLDGLPVEHRVLDRARPVRAEDLPDADVIVATWWETAEWVAALPPSKGAPAYFIQGVEWTIDGMPSERVKQTWRLPMHKIVIADFMVQIARDEFGDDDLSHVPNAIDTALFHAPPRERNATPTVGFMDVGLHAIMGGDITRAALRLAKERVPELRAVGFGRSAPPPSAALPSWVELHVQPSPEALRALYASCDVFVRASRAEGFGLPLLEAMACRTPVAATPAGAAPELLPSGGGTLVPHDDPAALADALVSLATQSPEAWRARSDAAYARATGYTLDDATQRMESALQRAFAKAAEGSYARASARGDAGPTPPLATRLGALQPALAHGAFVARALVPREQAVAIGAAAAERDLGPNTSEGWPARDRWPAEAHSLLADLTHPVALAAIEDATGAQRLLLDPYAREQGLFLSASGNTLRRSFRVRHQDPPLTRRFTLMLALVDADLELWHPHVDSPTRYGLQAGDALLGPAGLDQLVDTQALRVLMVPLYQPVPLPDELPSEDERVLPAAAEGPFGSALFALRRGLTQANLLRRRMLKRARDRWMGHY